MTQDELNHVLYLHRKWLNNEGGGERADLHGEDLHGLDMRGAIMDKADMRGTILKDVDMCGASIRRTILRSADMRWTILKDADMCGADIDYSCLPLWCGSLEAHFDDRQLKQIAYHLVRAGLQSKNASPETKRELSKLIDFANGFHRVEECGKIEWEEDNARD